MPKTVAVLFADSHLTTGWREPDSFYALRQISQLAIALKVKWVIGLGDLIDKQRNRSAPINCFHSVIDGLQDRGIQFGFLQGNHDYDEPAWLAGHRNAVHLHKQLIELGKVSVYGLDYLPAGKLQEELAEIPDTADILLSHQCWSGWMGDIALPQGDFEQIPHVGTVISGDLHKNRCDKFKGADGQKLTAYSPGCTYQKTISEPSQHFALLLDDDGTIRQHKLNSRPFIDWPNMVMTEDLDNFAAEIGPTLSVAAQKAAAGNMPEDLMRPMLRVTYSSKLPDTVRRVEKIVDNRAILYWKELPPEEKQTQTNLKVGKGDAVTPLSELANEVNAEEEPELFQLLQQLLETQTVDQAKQSLAKWRADFLEQGA